MKTIPVPSLSTPGVVHEVAILVRRDGTWAYECPCPLFAFRHKCRHVTIARAIVSLYARCRDRHGAEPGQVCATCLAELLSTWARHARDEVSAAKKARRSRRKVSSR